MRISGRALRAFGILAGFYAGTVGTLVALAAIDVLLVLHSSSSSPVFTESKVIGGSVLVAVPLVRGLVLTRRRHGAGSAGVSVSRQEQPALWGRVLELCDRVGVRPPAEIRLVSDVNAGVDEVAHLMGLIPGRRRMYLGVPLLVGLTAAQLDAVLAHELGHYSNRDARLTPTIVRGRIGVLAVLRSVGDGNTFAQQVTRTFFTWYAELYLRTSQSISRHQEFAADDMAARIAGRDNTIAALREIPVLDFAFDLYLHQYVSPGWEAGVLPPPEEFFAGLRALLAEPDRRAALESVRERSPEGEPDPYDSHPPLTERIAALRLLPEAGRAPEGGEPALALLRDAGRVCARVAATALDPKAAASKRVVGWDELARAAGRRMLSDAGAPVLRTASAAVGAPVPDLPALLAAIDAGWLDIIAGALPKSSRAQQATGRIAREFARTALRDAITPLALLAMVDAGLAGWTNSWARGPHLRYAAGRADALDEALDALVAGIPDTRPLRRLLSASGRPPGHAPSLVPTGT
ncbi:M48 family metallopeptidase [Rugosimonospora africana]|uniref:Zn-dependent protease n=1 Tax=Rugosimonospora africana TaxID=556532 RepID=A0A8J3QR98_9ACTN|nr:M48 family metallopeptidase [Rugosimonospora africana]GIH15091.1 Zn-dependent protease [Rugosimonospora africana]